MKKNRNKATNTNEEKKNEEEIKKARDNIKNTLLDLDPNMPEDMLEELTNLLHDKSVRTKPKRGIRYYINFILKEMFSFFIIYVCTTVSFGFFRNEIALNNLYMLFLVSLVISIVFFLYKHLYFKMHGKISLLLLKKLIVLTLVFTILVLVNKTLYKVFYQVDYAILYLLVAYNLGELLEHRVSIYIL